MNVLLAEDNPVNQEIAVGLLEVLDCKVTVAENGRDAVEAAGRDTFDLVLMDCQMPVMDGIEATRAIRASMSGAEEVPIVALTANDIETAKDACLAAGMDDLLSKPFTLEDLTSLLDRWRNNPRARPLLSVPASIAPPVSCYLNPQPIETLKALDPNGDRNLVHRTIEKFLRYSDELVAQLREATDLGDSAEVSRIAHSLKSSSANLGAADLARQCAEIEKLTAQSNLPLDIDRRLVELRAHHEVAKQELQAFADGG